MEEYPWGGVSTYKASCDFALMMRSGHVMFCIAEPLLCDLHMGVSIII